MEAKTETNQINELMDLIGSYTHDPVGYVEMAYDWGYGELEGEKGVRLWQKEVLEDIGAHLRDESTRHEPLMLSVASGHGIGKAESVSTRVICVNIDPQNKGKYIMSGIDFGDLKPGDYVLGKDGCRTEVLQIHPQGILPIYKMTFDDGSECMCSLEHLWGVRGRQQRRNGVKDFITLSTKELMEKGVLRKNGKAMAKQWEIPIQGAAQMDEVDVYNSYAVGVWLGDGCSSSGTISSTRNEIWEKIGVKPNRDTITYKKNGLMSAAPPFLTAALKEADMMPVTCDTKFIADCYKYNAESVRRELVSGMLDTDGEVNESGSIGYSSTSKKLVEDLIWMIRSLGGKATMQPTVKKTGYKKDGAFYPCKDCYRCTINFGGKWNPFTHTYKKAALKDNIEHRYLCRWIESIEYSHDEEAMCITVDAPDHLYLANDFIVTHNSALVGMIIDWGMNTCEDTRVVVTANTDTQLKSKTQPEVSKWFKRSIASIWWKVTKTRIFSTIQGHDENWKCDFTPWSEHNTEAFAGLHNEKKRIILIFDEASAIADNVWEVAEGALTDKLTEIIWVCFGNPTRVSGRFRECFRKYKHRWIHRQIDSRTVEGINLIQVKKWQDDYGVDSDFFKVRVRGQFPSSGDKQFISTLLADAAVARGREKFEYNLRLPLIVGIDFARSGDDKSVVRARRGRHLYHPFKFKERNSMKAAAIIMDYLGNAGPMQWGTPHDAIFADGGSIGGPIIDRMVELNLEDIHEIQFGSAADDPKQWGNKRIEMWADMRDWLDFGFLDDDQEIYDDVIAPELLMMKGRDVYILESKEDMKARGIPSTDDGDALALTFARTVMKKKPKVFIPPVTVVDSAVGY